MAQLVLLVLLLFLPINVTPYIAVWLYEKLLLLAEPVFSVIEAGQVVLVVTHVSQSLVDDIEDRPVFVKSTIIGIALLSYSLVLWISCSIFMDEMTTQLESWVLFGVLAVSVLVLVICLIHDEGIISDAAVVSLVMVCVLWALKQERIMSTNTLKMPRHWTQSLVGGNTFLFALTSMATTSLSHLGQAQEILRNLVSPTYLMLAAIRVGSVICSLWLVRQLQTQGEDEPDEDTDYPQAWKPSISPLLIRLVFIFVYTEFLIRSVVISTERSMSLHPSSLPGSIGSFLSHMLCEVRIWRVLQLCISVITYFFVLLRPRDS